MFGIEVRTFEQRFGARCFCGASWGDPTPCGDSRASSDYTIEKQLARLFADRKAANCSVCDKQIPGSRKYCYDCAANVAKFKNGQDRHKKVAGAPCIRCGAPTYSRKSKPNRFCSLTCSNYYRYGK